MDKLVADYGFQWTDPNAPILNEQGAQDLTFTIYSSQNASALDYNDMKIMQDLFAATNVNVSWENVSESVYTQQKNLIFSNKNDRPDAIYHAGMSAGEIIRYAKRGVLVTIGAGDAFCACVLNYVLDHGLEDLTEAQLGEMLRFANAAASLITTRKGALKVMPSVEEVNELLIPQSKKVRELNCSNSWTLSVFMQKH